MLRTAICKTGWHIIILLLVCAFTMLAGCQENQKKQTSDIESPAEIAADLAKENQQLKTQNTQLQKQIKTLTGLDASARTDVIASVDSISLTGRCGIYNKTVDANEQKMLVVYLKTTDDIGDVIKAAGEVKIELWNLNTAPANALLADWTVEPAELKKLWSGSLTSNYFKIQFDISNLEIETDKALTLKVEFTDYLTGRIFSSQQSIEQAK